MEWLVKCSAACALIFGAMSAFPASAERWRGFLPAGDARGWYVDYEPGRPGAATFILVNGLTYDTEAWSELRAALQCEECGLLRVDLYGQGRTLIQHAPIAHPVPYQTQVRGLHSVIEQLQIPAPLLMVGLSYGGGIALAYAATHPSQIRDVILLAPFTAPTPGQDAWIRAQVAATRWLQPWNPASNDQLYDFYLRQLVYSSYPLAEPALLTNPFKLEAAFRMVTGIRKIESERLAQNLAHRSLHLVVAGNDEYIPRQLLDAFWEAVPPRARASRLVIEGAKHKLPEVAPSAVAAWLRRIAASDPQLQRGASCRAESCGEEFSCD